MSQRQRAIRAATVVIGAVAVLAMSGCTPPSGLPTRQYAIDDFCTLEVRIVQDGTTSYVAARSFGLWWVDGGILGGPNQGCGAWRLVSIEAEATEGSNYCSFYSEYPSPLRPGCSRYEPGWYQAAAPGSLIGAEVRLCRQDTQYGYCDGLENRVFQVSP